MRDQPLPLTKEMRRIFDADDPLVLNGTYDVYGFKAKELKHAVKRGSVSVEDGRVYRGVTL